MDISIIDKLIEKIRGAAPGITIAGSGIYTRNRGFHRAWVCS